MTESHSGQVWARHPESVGELLELGVPVAVADSSGRPVTTISWRVESLPGPPGMSPPPSGLTVIAVDGDVDYDAAPVLSVALWRALSDRRPVCCDLEQVDYFGAAAARTILAAQRFAADMGKVFFLRGVHGITLRVLAVIDPKGIVRR